MVLQLVKCKRSPVKSSPVGLGACVLLSLPCPFPQLMGIALTPLSREPELFLLGTQVAFCGHHAYIGNTLYKPILQLRKLFVIVTLGPDREMAHNEYFLNE